MKTAATKRAAKSNICSGAGTWCPVGSTITHRGAFEGVEFRCCEACAKDTVARGFADGNAVEAVA